MVDAPVDPKTDSSLHMTLEHIVPLNRGGSNDLPNLALSCYQCNNDRGDSLLDYRPIWVLDSEHELEDPREANAGGR